MSDVPRLVAELIIGYLSRPRRHPIHITHVPQYPTEHIQQKTSLIPFGRRNILCAIPHGWFCSTIVAREDFYHLVPDIADLLVLRAVHSTFWFLLPFQGPQSLHEYYHVPVFVKQYTHMIELNHYLSRDVSWCVFPLPSNAPIYYAWHLHQRMMCGRSIRRCYWCRSFIEDASAKFREIIRLVKNSYPLGGFNQEDSLLIHPTWHMPNIKQQMGRAIRNGGVGYYGKPTHLPGRPIIKIITEAPIPAITRNSQKVPIAYHLAIQKQQKIQTMNAAKKFKNLKNFKNPHKYTKASRNHQGRQGR